MTVQPAGAYSIVRAILTDDLTLTADAVIERAKARGAAQPDATIRRAVYDVRRDLRGRKKPAKGLKPLSAYTLAREELTQDPSLSTDDLMVRLKSRGVTKKDSAIREVIRQTRGKLRRRERKNGTAAPKPIPVPAAATVTAPPPVAPGAADPFAGVRLANVTAQACGGVAKAREIAEAIRAVGGIDAFLERLDLVADILGSATKM